MTGDPLWTFACDVYGRPGVAEACLALQDEAGLDVTLLLYLIWCAHTHRPVDAAMIAGADARLAPWRDQVISRLRAVRRAMRGELLPGQATDALRERIKAAEIEAERHALAALSALAPDPSRETGAGADVFALYAAHLGRPLPDQPVRVLRAALAGP